MPEDLEQQGSLIEGFIDSVQCMTESIYEHSEYLRTNFEDLKSKTMSSSGTIVATASTCEGIRTLAFGIAQTISPQYPEIRSVIPELEKSHFMTR